MDARSLAGLKDVRFMHIRKFMANGTLKSTEGATIAVSKVADNSFYYYIARCSKKDAFCRHIGRAVAAGKLQKYAGNYGIISTERLKDIVMTTCKKYRQEFSEKSFSFLINDASREG